MTSHITTRFFSRLQTEEELHRLLWMRRIPHCSMKLHLEISYWAALPCLRDIHPFYRKRPPSLYLCITAFSTLRYRIVISYDDCAHEDDSGKSVRKN